MNHAADYFTATMPEPWQILGLRLRPFSLGHYKLLRRFECAFVAEKEQKATIADLLIGVLCCSMKVEEFLEMVSYPKPLNIFQRLFYKLHSWYFKMPIPENNFDLTLRKWGYKCGTLDFNSKVQLFKDYIEQQSVVPKYWEEKTGGYSGAHWSQCLEVTLRSKLGWSQSDIDTQPLCKAFADYFKYAENEGSIKLMTPEEIEFIESTRKGENNVS